MVRALRRIRLPSPIGAAVVLVALLALVGGGIAMLSGPAALWAAELPKVSKKLEVKFRALRAPLEDMRQAGQQVDKLTTLESPKDVPQRVVVEEGGLFSRTMGLLQSLGSTLGILFALLFFLLASGDLFRRKLQQILPEHRGERAVALVRDVQRNLSAYLVTITLINIGLGTATGTAMYLLGMPNPVLWGVMAAVLNFVPVVGAAVGVVVIALVGLISFPAMLDGADPCRRLPRPAPDRVADHHALRHRPPADHEPGCGVSRHRLLDVAVGHPRRAAGGAAAGRGQGGVRRRPGAAPDRHLHRRRHRDDVGLAGPSTPAVRLRAVPPSS